MDIAARAKNIKLLVLDVDGVLTDGQIVFGQDGELMKNFHCHDGMGITIAHQAGLRTAIITGRESRIVALRSSELKIQDVYQGSMNKKDAFAALLDKYKLTAQEAAYVGDDVMDLPLMAQAGLACAVANAVPEVKRHAHFIADRKGGQGAVREIVELLVKAQGKWDEIVDTYLQGGRSESRQ